MSRKLLDSNADQIIERYSSVLSVKQVASEFGVTSKVIARILTSKGVEMLSRADASAVKSIAASGVTDASVCDMFSSGIGIRGIFERTGTSISAVRKILARNGIPTRNRSEQQFARMAASSPSERRALASNAFNAVRGRVRSMEELCLMAATRESRGNVRSSVYEDALFSAFCSSKVSAVRQKAIGPYNCDMTIGSVAVEVFGGHWHWSGDHFARLEERFRYIMDSGYDILVVPFSDSFPFSDRTADYIISYVQELCSNPPAIRQYRVIWGAGEFVSGGCSHDDKISINPPFTNTRDVTTGRYKRVAG